MSYRRFINISSIFFLKISEGGGRGSRITFLNKLSQKSISYTHENIFSTLVSKFEKMWINPLGYSGLKHIYNN